MTFVASGDEEKRFRAIEQESGVTVDLLPGQCMLVVIIIQFTCENDQLLLLI